MAETWKKGDGSPKGGDGYTARRWGPFVVFDCSAKGCKVNADDRTRMEEHVAHVHGAKDAGGES